MSTAITSKRHARGTPPLRASFHYNTFADVIDRLGVPPERIRLEPIPGTATETDVAPCNDHLGRLCELVDGVLVEKPMGYYEELIGVSILYALKRFLRRTKLGFVMGGQGPVRLAPGLVQLPDVSVFLWSRFPNRKLPRGAFLEMAPDLSVEVLSPSNTAKEMERKRRECFARGTRIIWEVDPIKRGVRVYTSLKRSQWIDESGALDGGVVLPGFSLSVADVFDDPGERES